MGQGGGPNVECLELCVCEWGAGRDSLRGPQVFW